MTTPADCTGMRRGIWLRASIAAALIGFFAASAPAQDISWSEDYFNPQPAEEDLVLPMPCGGAMVFRRVDTSNTGGAIGDVPVLLGQEDDKQPFLNGLRRSYVSGAFSDDDPLSKSFYFIQKYEVTEAQFAAVTEAECPATPRRRDFVPQVDRSRLEFEIFAQAYTLWLMQNAASALPQAGQTLAYLRLPTEEEWEFAARGGLKLEEALFRQPLPPMAENEQISEYVAHGGADSAGGRIQLIGTLKPNALGLYDMLGNAAEVVGTPFALVRHQRLHGQAGGFVKRGGDARTPIESLNLATRFEVPPYDVHSGTPTTDRYTGARLVISALAINSPEQGDAMIDALDALARPDPGESGIATENEALALLEEMSRDAPTERERARLARVRSALDSSQAERNSQRDRSIRLLMSSAVLVCDQAVQRYLNALAVGLLLPDYEDMAAEAEAANDPILLAEVRQAYDEAVEQLRGLEDKAMSEVVDYANVIEGLGSDYSSDLLGQQLGFLRPQLQNHSERRGSCLALLESHLAERRSAGFADVGQISVNFQSMALRLTDPQQPL